MAQCTTGSVMVSVAGPVVVPVVVVIVKVLVPAPVIVAGAKLAAAPGGNPLALNATDPLNPFTAVAVTVYVVLFPAVTA